MTDRRLTPANARVAAASLRGTVDAPRYTDGQPAVVGIPVVDLLARPGGTRDRQLLFGATVTVYDEFQGRVFVQAQDDGYVGYLPSEALRYETAKPTHCVSVRATHVYSSADIKSRDRLALPLGANVTVGTQSGQFLETPEGFIPARHLTPVTKTDIDPVAVAARLIGTPYLWGGNSSFGIDCSGLVQIACRFCGLRCPGDSDMQETALGTTLPGGAPHQRGDLLFWKGHVAWVADPKTILHANAFHMATAYEPLSDAMTRIAAQGDGPVTRHARLF